MAGEFDPAEEMGLYPDRMILTNLSGFILRNHPARDVCGRFIRHGRDFYDVVKRYDALTAYVLGREEATAGNTMKWIVPFLKAGGATDFKLTTAYRDNFTLMSGAEDALKYISKLLPTYVVTSMYEHGWLALTERLDVPLCEIVCSRVELDRTRFTRADRSKLTKAAEYLASLRIPDVEYELDVPMEVHADDVKIIRAMDEVLQETIPSVPAAMSLMESANVVTSHRKAYQLLEARKQTGFELKDTMYIGGEDTDFQCMDLVRDSSGVSLSFNGTDFAVRGCNVAVLAKESTVGAVFASMFNHRGIEAVLELANNWNRRYIKNCDLPDENLTNKLLAANPKKLPQVFAVDRHNVDSVAEKSAEFRKKYQSNESIEKDERKEKYSNDFRKT